MNKKIDIKICWNFFDIIFALLCFLICAFKNPQHYEILFILPLIYIVCCITCFQIYQKKSLTCLFLHICAFLRYVVLPFFYAFNPVYGFDDYQCTNSQILNKAIVLMAYELLVVSVFLILYYLSHNVQNINQFLIEQKNTLGVKQKNKFLGVVIFLIVSVLLLLRYPSALKQINFVFLQSNTDNRVGSIASNAGTMDMLIRQVLLIAILSFFVLIVTKLKESAKISSNKALIISLLLAALCTCIIVSEQRSSQIYCAFAAIILLIRLYPEKRKLIIYSLLSICILVVLFLTIYKTFFAFKYDSYLDAIKSEGIDLKDISTSLEIYLLGPQTVASSIEFSAKGGFTFEQFFYDIGRSFIGISFFVKNNSSHITSEQFNLFISNGSSISGYLLPITGNAYCFVGFLLAPFLICIIYWLALKMEKLFLKSKTEYITFFSAYIYIRLATCIIFSNLATVLNVISSILLSAGLVYLFQKIIDLITNRTKTK